MLNVVLMFVADVVTVPKYSQPPAALHSVTSYTAPPTTSSDARQREHSEPTEIALQD